MKMKKALSIALALILAIGMLAGCGGNEVEKVDLDLSAFEDDGTETIELSWLGYANLSGCEEGTASELLIEDKFNVNIRPIFAESSKYTDKKNALLQSGDIPDLIYELDPAHVFADARDEYLLEVPYALIQQEAPALFADLTEKAPAVWGYGYYEGKNYGLPNINHAHMDARVPAYRGDWLKNVGKEIPTTVDELHDVLYAFVHEDPDGNGKDDTYGYAFASSHWQHYFGEIFGAYGVLPFDWQEVDGEVVYGGLREECETVLATLATWYEEGLIYPAFIESSETVGELFQAGQVGYSHHMGYQDINNPNSSYALTKQAFPEAEMVYAAHVKGPNGDYGLRGWGYPCHVVSFGDNDNSPKKVTRMLNMFETMFNDNALVTQIRWGIEGEQYTINENTTGTSIYEYTADYTEAAQRRLAGYEMGFASPTFWTPFAPKAELYEGSFSKVYSDWRAQYDAKTYVLTDVFYKVDIVPSAPTYIDDIRNQQMAIMTEIVQGKRAADQYIEDFTKVWEATGGSTLLAEAQEYKSVLDTIYKEIGLN